VNLTNIADLGTLDPGTLVVDLIIGLILGVLIAAYYVRFGRTFSDRNDLARIIPLILVVTLFVIAVVKSSLALSLGLVGALSIVRFRTPIKEPEELAYLFLAIATGLGLGAGQRVATIVAVPTVLVLMTNPYLLSSRTSRKQNTFMRVEIPNTDDGKAVFDSLVEELAQHISEADLRRVDMHGSTLEATFYVAAKDEGAVADLLGSIRQRYPQASVTFVEQTSGLGF